MHDHHEIEITLLFVVGYLMKGGYVSMATIHVYQLIYLKIRLF